MARFSVDPDGIRGVARNMWLAPGRGYVCLFTAVPAGGVGGTCTTTTVARQRGISTGIPTPTHGSPAQRAQIHVVLVVPDDVRAVRIASGKALIPHRGLVRLPPRTYNPRLLR
jgi:hypothetical protein